VNDMMSVSIKVSQQLRKVPVSNHNTRHRQGDQLNSAVNSITDGV